MPRAFFDVDDELLWMSAVMDGATTKQLRPDALELGVEVVMFENFGERRSRSYLIKIEQVVLG